MTSHEIQVLRALEWFCDDFPDRWARPMDVGGRNGSHHGATLAKLFKSGLVERKRWLIGCRHTNKYRITDKGRASSEAALEGTQDTGENT